IMLTPGRSDAFATQQDAFDTAAEFTRKLRFLGYPVEVRARSERRKVARGQNENPKRQADAARRPRARIARWRPDAGGPDARTGRVWAARGVTSARTPATCGPFRDRG